MMFTGIVEEVGMIKQIEKQSAQSIVLTVQAKEVLTDVKRGDSMAVNGICLTVIDFDTTFFQVDVMPETMHATSLGGLSVGEQVNLERAMAANGRFGGHFMSGHVDGTGEIVSKQEQENAVLYTIKLARELATYTMLKGSIAIEGVSLTVFGRDEQTVTISLIPHTRLETNLGNKNPGDMVNIECDLLLKYMNQTMFEQMDLTPNGSDKAGL